MLLTVVGAIGAGKTTLMRALEAQCQESLVAVYEATDKWKETGLLEDFYRDPEAMAFTFQLSVFNDYVDLVQDALAQSPATLLVERSIYCQPLFWALQPKKAHEDAVYRDLWGKWRQLIPEPTAVIFLDTDNVEQLLSRIKLRGRPGEEGVTGEYERRLIEQHKEFYTKERFGDRLIVLDALKPIEENVKIVREKIKI